MHMKGFNGHPRSVLQTTGLTRALLQQATTRRYTSDRGSKPTEHPTPPMGILGVFALYLVLEVGNNQCGGGGQGYRGRLSMLSYYVVIVVSLSARLDHLHLFGRDGLPS